MPAIRADQRWGQVTYGDREQNPVPLRQAQCRTPNPAARSHICKLHTGHDGGCRCICGMSWAAKRPA